MSAHCIMFPIFLLERVCLHPPVMKPPPLRVLRVCTRKPRYRSGHVYLSRPYPLNVRMFVLSAEVGIEMESRVG